MNIVACDSVCVTSVMSALTKEPGATYSDWLALCIVECHGALAMTKAARLAIAVFFGWEVIVACIMTLVAAEAVCFAWGLARPILLDLSRRTFAFVLFLYVYAKTGTFVNTNGHPEFAYRLAWATFIISRMSSTIPSGLHVSSDSAILGAFLKLHDDRIVFIVERGTVRVMPYYTDDNGRVYTSKGTIRANYESSGEGAIRKMIVIPKDGAVQPANLSLFIDGIRMMERLMSRSDSLLLVATDRSGMADGTVLLRISRDLKGRAPEIEIDAAYGPRVANGPRIFTFKSTTPVDSPYEGVHELYLRIDPFTIAELYQAGGFEDPPRHTLSNDFKGVDRFPLPDTHGQNDT
jgi:hypothetical protein